MKTSTLTTTTSNLSIVKQEAKIISIEQKKTMRFATSEMNLFFRELTLSKDARI